MREGTPEEVAANRRSPKNRFLLLFCHAESVDDHWGCNWTFQCGVIMAGILIGVWTIFDIATMADLLSKGLSRIYTWFSFWCGMRFLSDLIAIISIILSIISISKVNFKLATVAYYALMVSFVINTVFVIYCITCIFSRLFWEATTYRLIVWILNEFVLVIGDWILFCNMVDIGRRIRKALSSNF